MSKTFFTSDTHFFHENVISFCNRPYGSIDHMNDALISNWNSVVDKESHIWFLGDFSFGKDDQTIDILQQLNGFKYLIVGNHDRKGSSQKLFKEEGRWKEFFLDKHDYYRLKTNNQKLVLCHFPFASWERGYINLHGHWHSSPHDGKKNKFRQWDVGVDNNNYTPILLEDAVDRANQGEKHGEIY